jgi:hypothetical protein
MKTSKILHNFGCLGAFVLTVNGLYYTIDHQVVCNNKGDWLDHFAVDCNQGVTPEVMQNLHRTTSCGLQKT